MNFIQGLQWVAWNIFLAIVPVFLAYAVAKVAARGNGERMSIRNTVLLTILGFLWIVFLPNTCYLLTEWRHFLEMLGYTSLHLRWQEDSGSALLLMMLTFFYLCYSGVGVLTFALAIRPVVRVVRDRGYTLWVWGIPFFLLMSLGVYLGLVRRFNSWDLLNQAKSIWLSAMNVSSRPMLMTFVILFAAFLWLVYIAVDIWIDGFLLRLSRRRQSRISGRPKIVS